MKTALDKFIGATISDVRSLGWFGLAADPPTLAHRAIVDAALSSGLVEKIIVFPAGKLTYKDFVASDWQRNDMLELWKSAAEFADDIIISRFDILGKDATSWYELWNKIETFSPEIKHFLIVGSDQYLSIPGSWYRGRELLNNANFLIVPREGHEAESVERHHVVLPMEPLVGSSTGVRHGDFSELDDKVRRYILENGLYTSKK